MALRFLNWVWSIGVVYMKASVFSICGVCRKYLAFKGETKAADIDRCTYFPTAILSRNSDHAILVTTADRKPETPAEGSVQKLDSGLWTGL